MFKTYILENPVGKYYIGYTSNIEIRLVWHNSNKSKYTSNKGPWRLIYSKEFENKSDAIKFEKYLKSLKNKSYLKKIIVGE